MCDGHYSTILLNSVPSKVCNCAVPPDHLCSEISFLHTCNIPNFLSYVYIYLLHRSLTTWNASLVVWSHGCAIACTLKQTSAQCKIFLEGTLLLRQCYNKIFGGSQNNALPLIINILLSLFRVPVVICLSNNVNCHAAILMFNLLD